MYPKTLFQVHILSIMCKKVDFWVQKMWKIEHDGGVMLLFRQKCNIRKAFILLSIQKVKYGFVPEIVFGNIILLASAIWWAKKRIPSSSWCQENDGIRLAPPVSHHWRCRCNSALESWCEVVILPMWFRPIRGQRSGCPLVSALPVPLRCTVLGDTDASTRRSHACVRPICSH